MTEKKPRYRYHIPLFDLNSSIREGNSFEADLTQEVKEWCASQLKGKWCLNTRYPYKRLPPMTLGVEKSMVDKIGKEGSLTVIGKKGEEIVYDVVMVTAAIEFTHSRDMALFKLVWS